MGVYQHTIRKTLILNHILWIANLLHAILYECLCFSNEIIFIAQYKSNNINQKQFDSYVVSKIVVMIVTTMRGRENSQRPEACMFDYFPTPSCKLKRNSEYLVFSQKKAILRIHWNFAFLCFFKSSDYSLFYTIYTIYTIWLKQENYNNIVNFKITDYSGVRMKTKCHYYDCINLSKLWE